jgi:hypothetical protein
MSILTTLFVQAVKFLHESGVLLHYDDASLRLKDYYFIDPGWLCQMMAQIITVRQINPFINTDGVNSTLTILTNFLILEKLSNLILKISNYYYDIISTDFIFITVSNSCFI